MTNRRKLVAGNWKMNGLGASLSEIDALIAAQPYPTCDVIICPPATLIAQLNWRVQHNKSTIKIGGQDCHDENSGAHTGDISAAMLKDAGASHVILGHSERRADHGETDALIRAKTETAFAASLIAIICVGEIESQRDGGETLNVVAAQLAASLPDQANATNTIIAYEPGWAIGTGRTPTLNEIAEVHDFLRGKLTSRFSDGDKFRILYGGSVKPGNAAEIFAVSNVDGGLVGGASLKAADFGPIVAAAGA